MDKDVAVYDKRARKWDRWVTGMIVVCLMIPFPFVRLESWPGGEMVLERMVMPWSSFKLCYVSLRTGEPVEEKVHFTWKGEPEPSHASRLDLVAVAAQDPPKIKWHNLPEQSLEDLYFGGESLRLKRFWQPLLLWPFAMLKGAVAGMPLGPSAGPPR